MAVDLFNFCWGAILIKEAQRLAKIILINKMLGDLVSSRKWANQLGRDIGNALIANP